MTEYQRWRICTRKRPLKYKQAVSEANRKRGDGIPNMAAYKCPICGKWHVGKDSRSKV